MGRHWLPPINSSPTSHQSRPLCVSPQQTDSGEEEEEKKKKKNTKPPPPMGRLNYDSTPFISAGVQVSHCFISFSSIKMISRREWSVSLSEPRCCVAERGDLKSCLSPNSTLIWVEETIVHPWSWKTQLGSAALGKGLPTKVMGWLENYDINEWLPHCDCYSLLVN